MSINTIKERIKAGESLLDVEKMVYINYSITEPDPDGKMDRIQSISTSALLHEGCALRANCSNTICSKCYARRELNRKKKLREKMEYNTLFYTKYELTSRCIPFINSNLFRFESFGEIQNELQVKNYYSIARKNQHCFFVLWTKETKTIQAAREKYNLKKPGNLRIIASEYLINPQEEQKKKYTFIDKIFSVYTKEFATEHEIKINCSGKCIDCMKCYDKNNKEKYIREDLK